MVPANSTVLMTIQPAVPCRPPAVPPTFSSVGVTSFGRTSLSLCRSGGARGKAKVTSAPFASGGVPHRKQPRSAPKCFLAVPYKAAIALHFPTYLPSVPALATAFSQVLLCCKVVFVAKLQFLRSVQSPWRTARCRCGSRCCSTT